MIKLIFSTILLLVIATIQTTFAFDPYHSPRRIEATFVFEMIVDQKDFDKDRDLQYWLALPTDFAGQEKVAIISISPKPGRLTKNPAENHNIGYWNFSELKQSNAYSVKIDLRADLYKIDYFLDPEMVPDSYDRDKTIFERYTKSDSLACITPEIVELANELTRMVDDPFLKARNIYRWVFQHLEHQFPIFHRGTRFLFANPIDSKKSIYGGDSAEYSWVFIALCRAAGVPARVVVGFLAKPGWETPHTWAEFYVPKWGWLPADPYLADSKELLFQVSEQYDAYYYLGHLDNYHLAFYKCSGFTLEPKSPYSHKPYIYENSVWYAPIGIWNFDKFSNASANLMVTLDANITETYQNPKLGVEFKLPDSWLHKSETDVGPYVLKEHFLTQDKLANMDFIGRKLSASFTDLSAKEAAQLEIRSLKRLNRSYHIVSEKAIRIGKKDVFEFIAGLENDNQLFKEYRVYIIESGYLFWFIGSAEDAVFKNYLKDFQKITRNLKLNILKRRSK